MRTTMWELKPHLTNFDELFITAQVCAYPPGRKVGMILAVEEFAFLNQLTGQEHTIEGADFSCRCGGHFLRVFVRSQYEAMRRVLNYDDPMVASIHRWGGVENPEQFVVGWIQHYQAGVCPMTHQGPGRRKHRG